MVTGSSPVARQRLFFALVPHRPTLQLIENVQRKLKAEHRIEGRAVKANQFHVTLAFLGNQPINRLPTLLDLASALDLPACSVRLDRLGRFRRSGVIWLGATAPPPELCAFQARLVAALTLAGIELDHKPWKFHLTLYRDLRTPWVKIEPDTVSWDLNEFSLVESISIDRGVEYRPLGRWTAG